jgi:prepilin-type N-terminal cleavage/methylation domain-containing protein
MKLNLEIRNKNLENYPMIINKESGFTIIEVLFAMALFSVGLFAISMMQAHFAKGLADSRSIVHATDIGMNKIDELSNLSGTDSKLNAGGHTDQNTDYNRTYNVTWNVDDKGNGILEITVIVAWSEGGKNHSLNFPWVRSL